MVISKQTASWLVALTCVLVLAVLVCFFSLSRRIEQYETRLQTDEQFSNYLLEKINALEKKLNSRIGAAGDSK